MKTSNKLVLAALILIIVSLIGYDFLLKAEDIMGSYNNKVLFLTSLQFKDFDAVDLNSSSVANVKIIQGPFSVNIDKHALDYVKVTQHGRRLEIDAVVEPGYSENTNPYILEISCPILNEVKVNANYLSKNKMVTDTVARENSREKQVLIDGFKQDSLNISQDYGCTVKLANNIIRSVNAVIGKSTKSGSKIIIMKSNQFQNAKLDIRNKSSLILDNAIINHLNYQLADSAKLVLSGAAQNLLKK